MLVGECDGVDCHRLNLSELKHRGNNVSGFVDAEALKSPIGLDNVVGLSAGKAFEPFGQNEYPVIRPGVRILLVVPGRCLHNLLEDFVVVPQFVNDSCDKQALFLRSLHRIVRDTKKPPCEGGGFRTLLRRSLLMFQTPCRLTVVLFPL